MKQIAQNYKSGELVVLDVPAPVCRAGGVLVRSLFSLISTGTEMMKVSEASMSMVGMARARPDQVRKVLDTVQQQGVLTTYKKVVNRLDSYTPLGYSLCGVVTEVGRGAEDFTVGQLVAAAGNEHALHAEYNWIPVNLCAAGPPGVLPEHAAVSTVASIAMHGVRRAEVQLGETAAVIGLGLVGQLVVRLLVAAGVQVVGLDPVPDRCRLAEQAGAVLCGSPAGDSMDAVVRWRAAPRGSRLLRQAAALRDRVDPDHLHPRGDEQPDHELADQAEADDGRRLAELDLGPPHAVHGDRAHRREGGMLGQDARGDGGAEVDRDPVVLGMQRMLVAGRGDQLSHLEFVGPAAHLGHHPAQRVAERGIGVEPVHDLLVGGEHALLLYRVEDLAHLVRARPGHAHHRHARLGHLHHLRAGGDEREQRPDEDAAGTAHRGGHVEDGQVP